MGRSIRRGERGCGLKLIRYQPLRSQAQFHRSQARFKGFSGPIGSGKSQALCQEAIRLAFVNGGTMGLLGAPTYPMLHDATRRALLKVLDENEIPFVHHRSESTIEFTQNGSKILLRSLDDYERLRGTNLAWFGIDELTYCKEDAWLRLEGRLREPKAAQHCGFGVWTPKGKDWVYRRFVGDQNPEYAVTFANPRENKHILETDPGFYDRLQRTYSDAFYRQEVLGEYLVSDNRRVYSGFAREIHEEAVELDPERPLLWALDFNVSPFCSVLCQRYGDDLYVMDELVLERGTSTEMADLMNRRYGQRKPGEKPLTLVIYGDASGSAMQTNGPNNYSQIVASLSGGRWAQVQTRVAKKNPAVLDRLHLVNSLLTPAQGKTRLHIDHKCQSLLLDFEQLRFHEDGIRVNKDADAKRSHSSDALGYLIWEEFSPRMKIGERPRKDTPLYI